MATAASPAKIAVGVFMATSSVLAEHEYSSLVLTQKKSLHRRVALAAVQG
jgi:hypothetical protein